MVIFSISFLLPIAQQFLTENVLPLNIVYGLIAKARYSRGGVYSILVNKVLVDLVW